MNMDAIFFLNVLIIEFNDVPTSRLDELFIPYVVISRLKFSGASRIKFFKKVTL